MIPFAPPRIDQKIIDEVTATLQSGWITTGPRTKEFEKRLTAYCGNRSTLCLNSATAGLELMLRWFGVGEGDEVILPAYTYASTANVIIHCGAKPVMVDTGDDFNIDCQAVAKAINENTKVIMPVDFGGMPCDYSQLNALVARHDVRKLFRPKGGEQKKLGRIMILSDAAHSLGAVYKGFRTGALTDATVFSFHAVKNLTTAEGGAIALNMPEPFSNDEIYKYLAVLSLHGQNKDALAKLQKGNWRYDIITAGYKCNMTDLAAAIGLIELDRYEHDMLPYRRHICEYYSEYFKKFDWAKLPVLKTADAESSYHLYPLRLNLCTEAQRDMVIQEIFNRDVAVNVHFIPLPMHSFYKNKGYQMSHYPVSYTNYASEISLPVYYGLTNDLLDTVCRAVSDAVSMVMFNGTDQP